MDSVERDERAKKGRSERGEKIHDPRYKKNKKGYSHKKKQIEDSKYLSFADKKDPPGESEDDPEPEDVNDQLWDPGTEDEDEEDDYEEEDDNY